MPWVTIIEGREENDDVIINVIVILNLMDGK